MRIVRDENGLFKVVLKGISKPFYVESYEIAFKVGGAK